MIEFFDTSESPQFPLRGYLLTIAFIALGVIVFLTMEDGYTRYKIQSTAATWPTTTGVVERSAVIQYEEVIPLSEGSFKADLVFNYEVNGIRYKINEAYIGQSDWWRDNHSAYQDANRYKVGDQVQVHYLPEDPARAAVETDFKILTVTFFWVLFIEAFALLALYSSLEQHWRFIKSRRAG